MGYVHEITVTEHGDGTVMPDSLNKNVRPIPATTDAVWGLRVESGTCLTVRAAKAQPDTVSSVILNLLADGTLEREEWSRFRSGVGGECPRQPT